jgi:hypothetical protein
VFESSFEAHWNRFSDAGAILRRDFVATHFGYGQGDAKAKDQHFPEANQFSSRSA